ncbi:zinc finger protein 260-like [Leptopilina boulardi]|uniref:zinc finger protein 260-like n=1 Tax=Leptopilina boulardi TaxID=63433 RepID=UPI0021F50F12|nr:zinc finger protein 260-like [Leptopilina boulardi]XP_051160590.1 zinc finger protein 260-like [Leptopilina boulardi]
MEVTPEDEAQAVLLEGVEGTQYITIHRADGESLGKGIPLFTLNGEIISEGMVVDMINADVTGEYNTTAQYYETEDLLPPVMTEEDQRLTAALVAVQIQQQQQQQQQHQKQMQSNTNSGLTDVVELQTLEPVDIYAVDPISETNTNVYSSLAPYKHEEDNNYKRENDTHLNNDETNNSSLLLNTKRSLPHKKRITRKLKQPGKKNHGKKEMGNKIINEQPIIEQEIIVNDTQQIANFKCQLCTLRFSNQLKFFEHLKAHYEPLKKETSQSKPIEVKNNVKATQPIVEETVEEFSESEDLMEGIRGVVEETGARIDFETDEDPLPGDNELNWPSHQQMKNLDDIARKTVVTANDKNVNVEKNVNIPKATVKKERKRNQKNREDHTCKHCKRYFNYKNSLIYHMRSHSGERPHQCDECGKSFFAASALKVHKRLHSGDKPYKCEDCGRKFRQWGDLKYHSTSIHSELRQFQCEYCGKDFARKYSLIVHRRIHTGEKNYCCEYCNKTFRASSYLQNHRKIHTGEKPHPCTICGKPFRVRSDMKRHMQTHTRGKQERNSSTISATNVNSGTNTNTINTNTITANNKNSTTTTATTTMTTTKITTTKLPKVEQDVKTSSSSTSSIIARPKTIQDLVDELKLEVEPASIGRYEPVALVAPEDNHESILPHAATANLEYSQANNQEAVGRELEPTIRNSDNFHFLFM